MKLSLTVAAAFAGLLYVLVKTYLPAFPITEDQLLQILILILGALGVVVTEERVRSALVARGFEGFRKDKK